MKQLSLLLVMICLVCLSWATIEEYYTFNATTGTYTPITGTDAEISTDDLLSAAIPIGFTFGYGDSSYSEVKISSNGWIGLGTSQTGSNLSNSLSSTSYQPVVAPLWDDISMASGTVSYLTTGTAPNRIFTVQYDNTMWNYGGPAGFNFQVQLYETGKVSFIYGSNAGTPNNPSASIGINMTPGGAGWFYSVDPTSGAASTTTETTTITTFPAQGTVYEFIPFVAQANDLAATAISGNTTPSVGVAAVYTITLRNRGTNPQSNYQVKLIDSNNNELGSTAGTTIQSNETLTFQVSWTPTVAGAIVIRGKVVLTGDQNPTNDLTPTLSIAVQPEGVQVVTIADGTETMRIPMDFYWKNSLSETIYLSDELGFVSGTIYSLAFYTNFADSPANGATKIWLGSTNVQDLSGGWIPSTQLTLVFDGNINYPMGTNTITIPLQTPYMHIPGNLVMLVQRPMDTQYYSSSDNFYGLTIGANRTINIYSDGTVFDPANPPTGATLTGLVPKTTIFYSGQAIVNDLGCLSITGNITPSVGAVSNYIVTIKNNGTAVQTNYTVKIMKEGGIEVASMAGPAINSLQTLPLTIPWTPTQTGATYIYGEVVLANDEIATNNQTRHLNVNVQPEGIMAITIADGTTTFRVPMDFYYKNSLYEVLYYPNELGFASGTITSLAFYNNFADSPANGTTKIWLGYTTLQDLSGGWIPSTQLSLVFDGNVTYPTGINTIVINLQTPYMYNSGNLVMLVQRPYDATTYSSIDYFYGVTIGSNRSLYIYNSYTVYDPANPPAETTPTGQVPKTTIFYTNQPVTNDIGCLGITGNATPCVGTAFNYIVTVKNNGIVSQTNYTVKLIKEGGIEVGSVQGPPINSLQTLPVTVPWTPTQTGATYIYGEVVLANDEFATNNQTQHFNVNVQPEGILSVTIADGTENFRMPMDFFFRNSLNETLFFADELGFISGTITTLAFYTNFADSPTNGATKIWLGSTNVQDLTGGWIPSTQLTLVFDGNITYPAGINNIIIPLQTPYMHTPGNLVMMVQRPMDTVYYSSLDYFYGLTIGTNRVLNIYNDGTVFDPANPPTGASLSGTVPKTTFFYTGQLITNDLGCLSISGNTTPSVNIESNYVVTIKNNGTTEQTNYTLKLMKEGEIEVGSVQGPAIGSLQTLQISVTWTPTQTGATYIYGKIVMANDEIATNNETAHLNVEVMPAGITVLQIGQGTATNSTTGSPTPYGTWYKNFRQQYLYTAADIYAAGGAPGLINSMAFYVTAVNNCSSMPNYTIKIKHTDQTELTTTFETGDYTTVWVNDNYLPTTGWNVHTFTTPFFWNGASNLLIDICTDLIPGNYTENASVLYTTTTVPTCLRYQSDSIPASSATTGSTSVNRANTRLFMTISDMGSLTGVVSSGDNLLSNATVTIVGTVFQTITAGNGSYYFQYVPIGTQQVMATKHGYNEVTHSVTIVEDQTSTQNFELSLLPQVSVTGRIVGSDNPTAGLANATIALTGYEPYSAVTNASGIFLLPNVYTEHIYTYTVTAAGYQTAIDQVTVGSTNVNMGDILVTELTLPPVNVQATDNGAIASISWQAPGTAMSNSMPNYSTENLKNSNSRNFVSDKKTKVTLQTSGIFSDGFTRSPLNTIKTTHSIRSTNDRIPVGYQVWRMLQGQENNEDSWILLTLDPILALMYADAAWPSLPDGTYRWAVKTVYTNGVYSTATLSNTLVLFHEIGTIAGIVRNIQNIPIQGATVTCENATATTNSVGAYSMTVLAGTHDVTASHPNYQPVTHTGMVVVTGETTTVNFQLVPLSLPYSDGFENYPDFAINFAPWTLVDIDQSDTYGVQGYTWEHINDPQAFIVFNPSTTTPPLTSLTAHEGNKLVCSFAATTPPNNDWLITPQFSGVRTFKFWARSYSEEYGLERFKVGVSTTTNPNNFTIISGPNYIQAPTTWTEYTYQITQTGPLYIGIHCISNNAFIFCVDDVIVSSVEVFDNNEVPVTVTALGNNYPNPFNPETTISYSIKEHSPLTIEIYNIKGQLVKTLIKGIQEPGNHTIVWNGTDNNGHSVSSGVYYYKMQSGTYSSTRKMIMMK